MRQRKFLKLAIAFFMNQKQPKKNLYVEILKITCQTVICDQSKVLISATLYILGSLTANAESNVGKTGTTLLEQKQQQKRAQKTRVRNSAQGKKNHRARKVSWLS